MTTGGRPPVVTEVDALARAAVLGRAGGRHLLGITGAPGAGKSTLAAHVVAAVAPRAVLVPMDGFHLAQAELVRLGRADRKGAPDTFDAPGFVALLRRLRRQAPGPGVAGEVVYAPHFARAVEESVAGAVPVAADVPLVVIEGNYLLHDDGAWARVGPLLDECWFVEVDDALRVERLVSRHVAFGRTPAAARDWVLRSDEANARVVVGTRRRATAVVRPA